MVPRVHPALPARLATLEFPVPLVSPDHTDQEDLLELMESPGLRDYKENPDFKDSK